MITIPQYPSHFLSARACSLNLGLRQKIVISFCQSLLKGNNRYYQTGEIQTNTNATHSIEQGDDVGHTSILTTDRYNDVDLKARYLSSKTKSKA